MRSPLAILSALVICQLLSAALLAWFLEWRSNLEFVRLVFHLVLAYGKIPDLRK
jgi:hypothetical protein